MCVYIELKQPLSWITSRSLQARAVLMDHNNLSNYLKVSPTKVIACLFIRYTSLSMIHPINHDQANLRMFLKFSSWRTVRALLNPFTARSLEGKNEHTLQYVQYELETLNKLPNTGPRLSQHNLASYGPCILISSIKV